MKNCLVDHTRVITGCFVLMIVQAGCGSRDVTVPSPQNIVQEQVIDSVNALRKKLEIISTTGEGGSSLEGVRESIEKNVSNPGLKASLLKDATQLEASTNPEQNKKIAAKMLKTLKDQ